MFRHPIPLNTLCHHQANIAYDKLAVISDHIDELANVADCILDLKEYLFHILKLYVTLAKDETIPGKKKFTKPITTTKVNLYNEVDETDNIAFIETGWDNCAPYVDLHVDREDSQTHDQYKANIRLLLDPCDNYKAKFLIPYTDGEEDYSAVCVKYLKEQWQILKDLIDALTDRMSAAEGAITGLETKLNSVLNYPVDNSNELVTSDGIYEYGQTIKQELLDAISNAVRNVPDTNTTYSFTLNGSNLVITPSSGDVQTVDLSSLVSSGSGGSATTWSAVSQSWSQFRGEGASSGGSYKNLESSNTSLLGNISGAGTSYNSPKFTVSVAYNGEYGDGKCVDIGETFTCTNTDTNVSKSYIPLRLVVTYDGTRHSDGGSEPGGTYWQDVTAQVWYKEANYTLTSQDISDINAAADAFAASRSLGYDSGALS